MTRQRKTSTRRGGLRPTDASTEPLRAVAYVRLSKVKPGDKAKPGETTRETEASLDTQLAGCKDYVSCTKLEKDLSSAGAAIAPDLVKIAVDPAKPKDARETASNALVAIKAPGTGMALFDAAKADADFMIRGPLYAAAGASGDDAGS